MRESNDEVKDVHVLDLKKVTRRAVDFLLSQFVIITP